MISSPDPHGQAALMLCEGLMLLLIENGTVRKDQAEEVIEGVIDIKREIAGTSEVITVSLESIRLLRNVSRSVSACASVEPAMIR